ncbi:hypothetical protein [Luteolibacter soli]|uniref:Uncharacterized protein n=1 Tax=Luteolibacter soli TaxID=3135280 RepID=A0ABU9B4Z1_9BACT
MNTSALSEQQNLERPAAPPANDDLTIAEHLRASKVSRPLEGEDLYLDEAGEVIRVPEHLARKFVEEYGALHPGDYRSRYHRDWRHDFCSLKGQLSPELE